MKRISWRRYKVLKMRNSVERALSDHVLAWVALKKLQGSVQ